MDPSSHKSFIILCNPDAGNKGGDALVRETIAYLDARKTPYSVVYTKPFSKVSSTFSDEQLRSCTDLIVIGGDGTLNLAINAIRGERMPVLSVIPGGSGNDFAKMLNIGHTLRDQLQTCMHGIAECVDLGECNGRKFLNGVGFGFDGQIIKNMLGTKNVLSGHLKYYYQVLKILATYREKPLPYSVDGIHYDKELLLLTIANGTTFGGGFKLAPDARIDDGWLDVCEIGPLSVFQRLLNIHRMSRGSHSVLDAVRLYRARQINVNSAPGVVGQIDGEYLGSPPCTIKILPASLKIRAKVYGQADISYIA